MATDQAKILVVDDDPAISQILHEKLELQGYTADIVHSAQEALSRSNMSIYQVYLIDVLMPEMDGLKLLKKLDISDKPSQAIMITGHQDVGSAKKAMELGAYSYLVKPFDWDDFEYQVECAFETAKLKKEKENHLLNLEDEVKRRTAALQQSERKFRSIFENATDGIIAADPATKRFMFSNPEMARITGYSCEELYQMGVNDIHPIASLSHVLDQFQKQAKGEITLARDIPVLRKDGGIVYCDINSSRIYVEGKDLLLGFFRDVTSKKRAEESMHQSEERFRTIFASSPVGIAVVDNELRFANINDSFCKIVRYPKEELLYKTYLDITHPEDRERDRKGGIDLIRDKREEYISEKRYIAKDGKIVWANVRATRYKIGHTNEECLLAVVEDISSRKESEQKLKQSEDKYRSLFESAPNFITLVNQDLIILDINHVVPGLDKNKVIGSKVHQYVAPEYHKVLELTVDKVFNTGEIGHFQSSAAGPDGSMAWYDNYVGPIVENGKVAAATIIGLDVTINKEAQEGLKKAHVELEESRNHYQTLVNDTSALLCRFLADGTLTFVNPAYCDYFGVQSTEIVGRNFFQFIPKVEREEVRKRYLSLSLKNPMVTYEHRVEAPDGTERWQEWTDRALFDARGKTIEYQSIGMDITDRKKAEMALEESLERFRLTLDDSYDLVTIAGLDAKPIWANKAWRAIFGDLPYAKDPFTLIHPDDRGMVIEVWEKLLKKDEKIDSVVYRYKKKNGEYMLLDATANKIIYHGNESVYVVAHDITERQKSEEALRGSASKLKEQNILLEEKNVALRELIQQVEREKREIGLRVAENVNRLVLPAIKRLRKSMRKRDQKHLDIAEKNLERLTSPFIDKVNETVVKLTQNELEICNMLANGLSTKEIGQMRNVSHRTIHTHRNNIRKKFGLTRSENLVSFLVRMLK